MLHARAAKTSESVKGDPDLWRTNLQFSNIIMRTYSSVLLLALAASSASLQAQTCVFVPSDSPGTGVTSFRPLGNGNPADPTFADMRYQVQIPASVMGNQPFSIKELYVAPAGSHERTFTEIKVRLGHNPNSMGATMVFNTVGFTATPVQYNQIQFGSTADEWLPLGMASAFTYNPAFGSLNVEFQVRDAGVLPGGTGDVGLRTDPSIPYVWAPGQSYNGTLVAGGGIKLRLCTDTYGTIEYGSGGCIGSNGQRPTLSYGGSAQIGSTLQVQLSGAPSANGSIAILVYSAVPRSGPLDLTPLGMTGCDARVFANLTLTEIINGGSHQVPLTLPIGLPTGIRYWNQWFCIDLSANTFGLTASNFGGFVIGS